MFYVGCFMICWFLYVIYLLYFMRTFVNMWAVVVYIGCCVVYRLLYGIWSLVCGLLRDIWHFVCYVFLMYVVCCMVCEMLYGMWAVVGFVGFFYVLCFVVGYVRFCMVCRLLYGLWALVCYWGSYMSFVFLYGVRNFV